ncbi:MAG: mechanosensitive channel MscK, partial [Pseudomonas fluorescens]
MSTLRTFIITALLGLSLSVGTLQAAEPPSSEAVQANLNKIADRKLPEADQKALQSILQSTLTQLNNQRDYEQKLADLKQQLANAPKQNIENQRELTKLKATKVLPVPQRYAKEPIQQLEQMLTERSTQQSDLQKALAEANSLVITAQTRPERAQAEISTSQTRIQQINNILKAGKDAGKTLTPEQRDL